MARETFLAANLKAQFFKTVFSLYYTPAKMAKWSGRFDGKCFRCESDNADCLHIFYVCGKLSMFISKIEMFLSVMTQICIRITAAMMLLGTGSDLEPGKPMYKHRYLLFLAMTVARLCIASAWLQPEAPVFEVWRARMYNIYHLEFTFFLLKVQGNRRWVYLFGRLFMNI